MNLDRGPQKVGPAPFPKVWTHLCFGPGGTQSSPNKNMDCQSTFKMLAHSMIPRAKNEPFSKNQKQKNHSPLKEHASIQDVHDG